MPEADVAVAAASEWSPSPLSVWPDVAAGSKYSRHILISLLVRPFIVLASFRCASLPG